MQNTLLSHLYLAGNYIGNHGLELLASGLMHNDRVMSLDISNNEITGIAGAKAIGFMLQNPQNHLRRLNISKNPLGNKGITTLASVFQSERISLNYLNLSSLGFTQAGAKPLYLCLRSCHFLKTLILDKNKLCGPSTNLLSVMLVGAASLSALSMNACTIRDEGFSSLCDGLERCHTLKSLSVSNNSISDASVKHLAKKFSVFNLALKHLDLSFNSITYKSGVQLMESLANNR